MRFPSHLLSTLPRVQKIIYLFQFIYSVPHSETFMKELPFFFWSPAAAEVARKSNT